jgi:DNA-binding CsgD family transcriptional regulator/predicted enzyme related to lactoylglutathione lyase
MRMRGRPPHPDVLTPAEWRTVNAVRHGLTNREIASLRGVSLDAVKYHVANSIGKLGVMDRRALRQWVGVPLESALNKENVVVNASFQLGPVGQISRTVRDIAEAEAWYGKVLGLKHLYTFGKLAFFDLGGTRLFLSQEGEAQKSESVLYLRVPDITQAHDELKSRGVEFMGAPHMIHKHPDGTEGCPLALMSQVRAI